jgi:hypothetical protein
MFLVRITESMTITYVKRMLNDYTSLTELRSKRKGIKKRTLMQCILILDKDFYLFLSFIQALFLLSES